MISSLFLRTEEYVGPEHLDLDKLKSQIELAKKYDEKEIIKKIIRESTSYFSRLLKFYDQAIKKAIHDKNISSK